MRQSLRYGCNPHQDRADFTCDDDGPVRVLSGSPGMINMLDALNAWQLLSELRCALDLPAAASFKHVSPAGAAVATPLPEDLCRAYEVSNRPLTPLATAYVRARGADPKCSFGDFVALSDRVDEGTADYLRGVVSDGVIAPGYEPGALETLSRKKGGSFVVIEADPGYEDARRDLLLGLITMKYTQSNSVGYALDGQMIGIGAGQQSRVDCTKLAGAKADTWHLGRHPSVLDLAFERGVRRQDRVNWRVRYIEGDMTPSEQAAFDAATGWSAAPLSARDRSDWAARLSGVSLVSDGFIPFRDNVDHARNHGVAFIAQPGGSARDDEVVAACEEYGIAMVHTGLRLFHH